MNYENLCHYYLVHDLQEMHIIAVIEDFIPGASIIIYYYRSGKKFLTIFHIMNDNELIEFPDKFNITTNHNYIVIVENCL